MFDKIPKKIGVHALRREYCQGLYAEVKENKKLKEDILKVYPPRRAFKTQKNKDGNTYTKEIQRDYYKDRDNNIWSRDCLKICTESLDHSRLSVCIQHYLKA